MTTSVSKPSSAISSSPALDSVWDAALSCSSAGSGDTSTRRVAPQPRAVRAALTASCAETRCIGEAVGTNVSWLVMQMYASSAAMVPAPTTHGLKRAVAEPMGCVTATWTMA